MGLLEIATMVLGAAALFSNSENGPEATLDVESKRIIIRCPAEGIPTDNFDVYIEQVDKKRYLNIKGVTLDKEAHQIIEKNHSFQLINVNRSENENVRWSVNEKGNLIIIIPLKEITKKTAIKKEY